MKNKILIIFMCVSSFLLARTDADKDLMINDGDIQVEYLRIHNENIIELKYALTENIELIPIGIRYRFINNDVHQTLVQLNLLGFASGESFGADTDIITHNSTEILGKIIYKFTPLSYNISTQIEYTHMLQVNNHSEFDSRNGNIQQISIEQFYYFYKKYAIGIKGTYLDGSTYWNDSLGYSENTYSQKVLDINLYFPITENFDIVASYQAVDSDSDSIIDLRTLIETHQQNDQFYGLRVLYRFSPSSIIDLFGS